MQQHDDEWELRLAAYIDGDLPSVQRRRVEAHLAACPDCRDAVELAQAAAAALTKGDLPAYADAASFLAAVEWRAERATAGRPSRPAAPFRSLADQLRPLAWFLAATPAFLAFQTTRPIGVAVGAAALALGALVDYALTREDTTHGES